MEVGDVVSARAGDLGWKYINASNVYSKTKCKGNAFSKQKFLGCYSSAFSKLWMLDNSSSSSLCWSADKVFSSMPRAASCCWTAVTDSDSGSVDATDTKELALPISLAGPPSGFAAGVGEAAGVAAGVAAVVAGVSAGLGVAAGVAGDSGFSVVYSTSSSARAAWNSCSVPPAHSNSWSFQNLRNSAILQNSLRTLASWQGRFQVGLEYMHVLFSQKVCQIFLKKKYDERFETPVPRLLSPLAGVQLSAETERIKASQIPSITVTVPLRVGGVMLHHLVEWLHLHRAYMGKGLVRLVEYHNFHLYTC